MSGARYWQETGTIKACHEGRGLVYEVTSQGGVMQQALILLQSAWDAGVYSEGFLDMQLSHSFYASLVAGGHISINCLESGRKLRHWQNARSALPSSHQRARR